MKYVPVVLFLGLTLLAFTCYREGAGSITEAELREHVEYLASDQLAGRMTGEAGAWLTEEYIAGEFGRYGLLPLPGQDDFFIEYEIFHRSYDPEGTFISLELGQDGRVYKAQAGVDFKPFTFSGWGEVEAEIVFAGYGITAPEYGYDDYSNLNASGKIVLVLRHEPAGNEPGDFPAGSGSTGYSRHAWFATKAKNAADHGAVGMILFTDPLWEGGEVDDLRLDGTYSLDPSGSERPLASGIGSSFISMHISQALACRLFEPVGVELEVLQSAINRGADLLQFNPGDVRVRMGVQPALRPHKIGTRNVVGFVEGRARAAEWILIGAHHDHLGSFDGEGDTVYNGADDNASGVSAVLELAEAFAGSSAKPERSLVFATFSGEELGLLGSRALIEKELIAVDRMVFMLNLDMIGRNPEDKVWLFTDFFSGEARTKLLSLADEMGLPLFFPSGAGYRGISDNEPFNRKDIPFLFFFTGHHDEYHRVTDHADLLSYTRMATITRLAYKVLCDLSQTELLNLIE